jgi:Raf kinase inhibitor-like YbhB/YbcL family protein
MKLTSPVFENNGTIPTKYGKDFENVNPPLLIESVPDGTASLVLLLEDPDVPAEFKIPVFDHWVVFNIPPTVSIITENWTIEGTRGAGTHGNLNYTGPRPPDREHRYFFKLFALDTMLELGEGSTKVEIQKAMEGHVIDSTDLMGRYAPQG